jgi:Alpha/beta hydrolase family
MQLSRALAATLTWGPLELYCERHGDGHPLVLLHGAFGTIESCFAGLLPALARNFEVVAVELQGHGRTRDIGRPLAHQDLAADLAALLKALGIPRACRRIQHRRRGRPPAGPGPPRTGRPARLVRRRELCSGRHIRRVRGGTRRVRPAPARRVTMARGLPPGWARSRCLAIARRQGERARHVPRGHARSGRLALFHDRSIPDALTVAVRLLQVNVGLEEENTLPARQ